MGVIRVGGVMLAGERGSVKRPVLGHAGGSEWLGWFGPRDSAVVIDRGVDVAISDPGPASGSTMLVAVTAVSSPTAAGANPAEFLDVDVDEVAGAGRCS